MQKLYDIKVPVYVSEPIKAERGLFGYSCDKMVEAIKTTISMKKDREIAIKNNKNPKTKEINDIICHDYTLGDVPSLLIQIDSSVKDNLDTYIQGDEKRELSANEKVGSSNYWLLMYPRLYGLDPENYVANWLIFVYIDPNKRFDDITNTAKIFFTKILGIKCRNIKSDEILSELRKTSNVISRLEVSYYSDVSHNNETDIKFHEYAISGSIKKESKLLFESFPTECLDELIQDTSFTENYQKKTIKIEQGKKTFKITTKDQINEATQRLKEFSEETFNMSCNVTEEEVVTKRIYDKEFIIEKLKPIIENYILSYVE